MIYLSPIPLILWYSSFKVFVLLTYLSAINVWPDALIYVQDMQITTGQQFPAFHFPTTKKHEHKKEDFNSVWTLVSFYSVYVYVCRLQNHILMH